MYIYYLYEVTNCCLVVKYIYATLIRGNKLWPRMVYILKVLRTFRDTLLRGDKLLPRTVMTVCYIRILYTRTRVLLGIAPSGTGRRISVKDANDAPELLCVAEGRGPYRGNASASPPCRAVALPRTVVLDVAQSVALR